MLLYFVEDDCLLTYSIHSHTVLSAAGCTLFKEKLVFNEKKKTVKTRIIYVSLYLKRIHGWIRIETRTLEDLILREL